MSNPTPSPPPPPPPLPKTIPVLTKTWDEFQTAVSATPGGANGFATTPTFPTIAELFNGKRFKAATGGGTFSRAHAQVAEYTRNNLGVIFRGVGERVERSLQLSHSELVDVARSVWGELDSHTERLMFLWYPHKTVHSVKGGRGGGARKQNPLEGKTPDVIWKLPITSSSSSSPSPSSSSSSSTTTTTTTTTSTTSTTTTSSSSSAAESYVYVLVGTTDKVKKGTTSPSPRFVPVLPELEIPESLLVSVVQKGIWSSPAYDAVSSQVYATLDNTTLLQKSIVRRLQTTLLVCALAQPNHPLGSRIHERGILCHVNVALGHESNSRTVFNYLFSLRNIETDLSLGADQGDDVENAIIDSMASRLSGLSLESKTNKLRALAQSLGVDLSDLVGAPPPSAE